MTERSSVFQFTQVAVEGTAGTNPAANFRKLGATSIEISPQHEGLVFRPVGAKLATLAAQHREWAQASISGQASDSDLPWLLAACLSKPPPAQQDSTAAYLSTFGIGSGRPDTIANALGGAGGRHSSAHSMTYGIVTDPGNQFPDDRSGSDRNHARQGVHRRNHHDRGPTELVQVPILPDQVSVYLADTYAGLAAASALERVLSVNWSIANRFGPLWVLNAANTGWVAHLDWCQKSRPRS
jgi:hypothetical protein